MIDGQPLTDTQVRDLSFNILAGGVDTTTALTSHALVHLGRNPRDRQRLIDQPDLLPFACEEFLRYFSPIPALSRTALADTEVAGWKIAKGERVLMAGEREIPTEIDLKADRLRCTLLKLGPTSVFTTEQRWTNQHDELVRLGFMTSLYY